MTFSTDSALKRTLTNVAVLGGSVVLALLLAEGAVRLVGVQSVAENEVQVLNEYDATLGWRKRANASVSVTTDEYDVTETTNSRGVRGPEYALAKAPGAFRILTLGDSFAEGYTVDFEALCTEVLKGRLNVRGKGRQFEVINAGTAGYSTDQEFLYFREHGAHYRPDLTILLFYVNDVWYNAQDRYWRGSKPRFQLEGRDLVLTNVPVPPPDSSAFAFEVRGGRGIVALVRRVDAWLGRRSAVYGLVRSGIIGSPWLHGMTVRLGFAEVPGEFRAWRVAMDEAVAEAWAITEQLLIELHEVTEGNLLVFHVPARPAVYDDDWTLTRRKYAMEEDAWDPAQEAKVLETICETNGLACVFPLDRFRQEAARLEADGKRLYFERDAHWTPEGHRLAGEVLADFVLAADGS